MPTKRYFLGIFGIIGIPLSIPPPSFEEYTATLMIVLTQVTKSFHGIPVLRDVTLRIDPGEFVCVTGRSGAGKSTLLALLIAAEHATTGTVEMDGVDLRLVPPPALQLFRRRVGIVFQDKKLLADRTVFENVAFPLEVSGVPQGKILESVSALLERLGLGGRSRALPEELSAGERARTALGRAIIHRPLILLADEPTADLDAEQATEVLRLIRDLHASGATVILATHDPALAASLQVRTLTFARGALAHDTAWGTPTPPPASLKTDQPAASEPQQKKVKITAIGSL